MTFKQPRWMNLKKIEMFKFVPVMIHSCVNNDDFEIFMMNRKELESHKLIFNACVKMIRKYWPLINMEQPDVGSIPIRERVPYGLEDMKDIIRSGGSFSGKEVKISYVEIKIPDERYDNKFEFAAHLLMLNGFHLYRPQFEVFAI